MKGKAIGSPLLMPQSKPRAGVGTRRRAPTGSGEAARVADLMSRSPISVGHRTTVKAAWTLMRARGIRHLLVLDDDRRLAGILSDHDLQQVVLDRVLGEPSADTRRAFEQLWVDEVMSWGPMVVQPDAGIRQAAQIMRERKIAALPVAARGRVVGMLTATDVIEALLTAGEAKRSRRAGRERKARTGRR
jgi:CBS domain-containing protein